MSTKTRTPILIILLLLLAACATPEPAEPVEVTVIEEVTVEVEVTREVVVEQEVELTREIEVEVTREVEVEVTREVEAEAADADVEMSDTEGADTMAPARTRMEKIANAMSAAPLPISQDATVLAYTDAWPGGWPDEPVPADALEELRSGNNGWTCIADIPTTPGNDPMCLNDVYLASLQARYSLEESPTEGIGFGYMLQGGGPVGSPPHMMYFAPQSNAALDNFTTEPGPQPWVMFPETTHDHLMVLVTPPIDPVSLEQDPIANAMSAGPAAISQDATIWAYTDAWPGEWPDGPAPEGALEELRSGSNGWTCIADIPTTPGNDPMCLNDVYLASLEARYDFTDASSEGIGFGYMLQGGGPVGSPPHMMYLVPQSSASLSDFAIEPGPQPWVMFPDTTYQHLMVLTSAPDEAAAINAAKIANAMSAAPSPISQDATILAYTDTWPGGWPDAPVSADALEELRSGDNGWTCIADIPTTPGNDPMCLNDVYFASLQARYNLQESPSEGIGIGYMLQGGGPVGSPPHMMYFAPESNASFANFTTEPGPQPWVMFPETTHDHLMVLVTPPSDPVSAEDDPIANAMSAGPEAISQDATIWAYTDEWPGEWPDGPVAESVLEELRSGSNGWTCIADIPTTPGNDPMCLNDVYLESLIARYAFEDGPTEGIGFGYMLQGGGPIGSPPHMMYFVPQSNGSLSVFTTEPGPQPWVMFPDTPYQHLMVLTDG